MSEQNKRPGSVPLLVKAAPARGPAPRSPVKLESGASLPGLDARAITARWRATPAAETGQEDGTISVLVVDDHPAVRAAIEALIVRTPGLRVVGSASGGSAAIEDARRLKPRVVIMDLGMPDINGVEATRAIRQTDGAPVVVAFSGSRELWRDARAAGAAATLLKDEDPDRLLEAIRAVVGS